MSPRAVAGPEIQRILALVPWIVAHPGSPKHEIAQRFGQLPGEGTIVTNVSLGDLTDQSMADAGDFYVLFFGPTTIVKDGESVLRHRYGERFTARKANRPYPQRRNQNEGDYRKTPQRRLKNRV